MNRINEQVKSFTDNMLLQLMKDGEVLAFEELYHRYWFKFYDEVLYRVGSPEAAAQIVQDVFIAAWTNRSNIESSVYDFCLSRIRLSVLMFYKQEILIWKCNDARIPEQDATKTSLYTSIKLPLIREFKVTLLTIAISFWMLF